MAAKIVVPELGESVLEATVGHWLKNEGDRVSAGDVLVTLETDKVDLEVGAERSGVLSKIERPEGEDVKIGDVLGLIGDGAEAGADGAPSQKPAAQAPQKAAEAAAKPEPQPLAPPPSHEPEPTSIAARQASPAASKEPAATPS